MCRNVKTLSICPTCDQRISENTNKQWCRDARRKGQYGRCTTGVRRAEDEFRAEECKGCSDVRESKMNELEMSDFAARGLGWKTPKKTKGNGTGGAGRRHRDEDSDDGIAYTW
jgi:hypothetical protein